MPKRPRQHIVEDLARAALRDAFARVGWTTEDLGQDYGEDVLVRIFDNGEATPWSFFVQSKATDRIDRFRAKDSGHLAFSVQSDHAKHWERFWEPVVLAIYDTKSGQTYWDILQTFLEKTRGLSVDQPRASSTVRVPTGNTLDDGGLERLRNRTKLRFDRFEAQKEGAVVLVEELKKQWGVKIDYGPELGILFLPKGEFKADPAGGTTFTAFGRYAAQLERLKREYGIEPHHAFEESIRVMREIVTAFQSGAKLQLRNPDGQVEQEWQTLQDFMRHIERWSERQRE
jgi:Domain of unknown function (DUF4365)